jgi:glutamine amidotransferase
MKKIAIVDFGLGNLFSVAQSCEVLGINAEITSNPEVINNAHGIILPGVGAFGDAMENIQKLNLEHCLKEQVKKGKPTFGICLGMQLMFERSYEFGENRGLGFFSGEVLKFHSAEKKIRVPQIAWNTIQMNGQENWKKSPFKTLADNEYMYFVHSFYVKPKDESLITSTTVYEGIKYCSSVFKDNLFAVQFHPEKSAQKGLEIYKNWYRQI